jgi:CRP/FNR family cyclic AMP-dependent transcriptional regulator
MAVVTDHNLLGEIALFRGLTAEQLSQLNDLLHGRTFPAGRSIITAEQPGEVIYVIASGSVKVHVEQADGTEVVIAVLTAGETVGEMSLLDCAGRSANVVTLEETTLFWMDRAAFQQCLRTMPVIHENLFHMLCNRLRLANERIQSLSRQEVEGRVARQLLALAGLYGQAAGGDGGMLIPIRLTQSDIASMVGATRERVNQVMAVYKQRGYISVDHNYRITVHHQASLLKRASC